MTEPKTRPLTDRQEEVLIELLRRRERPLTANEIGNYIGFTQGEVQSRGKGGSGSSCRAMGEAQRVIGSLTGLRKRGLVEHVWEGDNRTRFALTVAGWTKATGLAVSLAMLPIVLDDKGLWLAKVDNEIRQYGLKAIGFDYNGGEANVHVRPLEPIGSLNIAMGVTL